jgi:hypothetical protein
MIVGPLILCLELKSCHCAIDLNQGREDYPP